MFAGKTTELIRRLAAAQASGLDVLAVKPRSDSRSGHARLATHHGRAFPAIDVADPEEIPERPGVIAVDEAHFFGPALTPVCDRLLLAGKRLIIAGVHLDHRGRPFEPFPSLLPRADESVQLFAPCARCGRPAVHSHRKAHAEGRIVVGGADLYEPRCEACFDPS